MNGLAIIVLVLCVGGGDAAEFDCALYAKTCKATPKYQAYKTCASTADTNSVVSATGMKCRSEHLVLATSAGFADLHCPHAQPMAEAPCDKEKLTTFDCALYAKTCKGISPQYGNCASTVAVNDANSMACRIQHLALAAKSGGAAVHCAHAAPDATTPCDGEKLKAFDCVLYASTCKTAGKAYGDCANTVGANGANGMACRIQHLDLAAKKDGAAMHCPHAQFDAEAPCAGEKLKTFDCAVYAKTCKDVAGYEDYVDCAGVVAINWGGMQCRINHLGLATASAAAAAIHCKHAAPKAEAPCALEKLKPADAKAQVSGTVAPFCSLTLAVALSSVLQA